MKWFDRWFAKKCKQAWENENKYSDVAISIGSKTAVREGSGIRSEGIRMNMYHANGGYILEFEHYDRRTDQMDRDLYVIHEGNNLGENISQVVTMHLLKRS